MILNYHYIYKNINCNNLPLYVPSSKPFIQLINNNTIISYYNNNHWSIYIPNAYWKNN